MTGNQPRLTFTVNQSKYCPNLHKIFTKHPCVNGFIFISVVTFDMSELINDWLLFKDLDSIGPGLVYGPLDTLTMLLYLITCVLGTLLYCFEILNLLRDMIKGKTWLDHDLISAVIICTVQIPMIAIIITISLCHDEPVSYFQLTKTILICVAVIVRAVNPFLRTCVNKNKYSGNERFRNFIYRIVTTVGICLLLVGGAMMFVFSHLIGASEKRFKLILPQQKWTGNFVQEKYFTDVGIYLEINNSAVFQNGTRQYWIKLTDIHECFNSNPLYVKLSITESDNTIQKIALSKFDSTQTYSNKCYNLNTSDKTEKTFHTNCNISSPENISLKMIFKFVLIPSSQQLILGDIKYNALVLSDKCYEIWENSTGIYKGSSSVDTVLIGKLFYKKFEKDDRISDSIENSHIISDMTEGLSQDRGYLMDPEVFWVTGLLGCKCTGKTAPTLDLSSQVPFLSICD